MNNEFFCRVEGPESVQGSEEWKAFRHKFITASDVPILLGLSEYKTRLQLFEEKYLQFSPPDEKSKQWLFDRGHQVEQTVRERFEKDNYFFKPLVITSNRVRCLMASLDGITDDQKNILEVKYVADDKINDEVPADHEAQIQAQLLVSGALQCHYVRFGSKGNISHQIIYPDQELFQTIKEAAEQFHKQIQAGNPPDPSPEDYHIVSDLDFERMLQAKEAMDLAKKQFDHVKKDLVDRYKDYKRVRHNNIALIRSVRRGNVKYSDIPDLCNVDLEKYRGADIETVTVKVLK